MSKRGAEVEGGRDGGSKKASNVRGDVRVDGALAGIAADSAESPVLRYELASLSPVPTEHRLNTSPSSRWISLATLERSISRCVLT